jgi:hypothetical protein
MRAHHPSRNALRWLGVAASTVGIVGATTVLLEPDPTAPAAKQARPLAMIQGLPPGAVPCAQIYQSVPPLTASAIGTPFTSCGFAEEVRRAYVSDPNPDPRRVVQAASAVTRKSYEMTCSPNEDHITCLGGGDAVVYLFDNRP